ncbi:MAG: hypothetical protein IPK82_31390 [Polyangiaceae bacterium]|nr:hypothetical protein [Polyangiaceae bacterium]
MSVLWAFDLRFTSALRIGAEREDSENVVTGCPSDTLSAALVATAAAVYGKEVEGRSIDDLAKKPPWVVSSLLPWVQLDKSAVMRFVPRPLGTQIGSDGDRKAFQRVEYMAIDCLSSLKPGANAPKLYASKCRLVASKDPKIEKVTWAKRTARPSVTIDRVTSSTNLFHLEELWLGDQVGFDGKAVGAGAWILALTDTENEMGLLHALLQHLGERGLGADRTRGMGQFKVIQEGRFDKLHSGKDLSLNVFKKKNRMRCLLGAASPDEALANALENKDSRYSLVRRGGVSLGGQKNTMRSRKELRLVSQGARIPDIGHVVGTLRDITPDGFDEHRIWRDGRTLAFLLPETFA